MLVWAIAGVSPGDAEKGSVLELVRWIGFSATMLWSEFTGGIEAGVNEGLGVASQG